MVATAVMGDAWSIFANSGYASSESRTAPATRNVNAVAAAIRIALSRPAGSGRILVFASSTSCAAEGRAAKAGSGDRRSANARPSSRRRAAGEVATRASPKRAVSTVVGADVTHREAVGDHRATADLRLEHGQARGRVDERVGGGEKVAHPVGEAE